MVKCFNKNANCVKNAYRYTESLKLFMAHFRMVGGKCGYESFHANNFGAVPSLSRIDKFMSERNSYFQEGVMRTEELDNYLSKLNLPKIVSLSEDATRITGRVQYDAKTNEIIGFVLPTDDNGMPIIGSYPARTATEIESM